MDAAVRGSRRRSAVLAIATVLAVAGCSASATPLVIYVTPPPTPIIIYITPPPTPTPEATPAPTAPATETPTPTLTPTPTPTAVPASPAAACTGTDKNQAFFVEAAAKEPFDVYCAVLPKGWWLSEGSYTASHGGYVYAAYTNKAGAIVTIQEGAWCTAGPAACDGGAALGAASYGGLGGELVQMGTTYAIFVNIGTTHAYALVANGVTRAQAVADAAAMHRVPRS